MQDKLKINRDYYLSKKVNFFIQKIEFEKKSYKILNLVFDSTLSLFLPLLTTYLTMLRIYLATLIKKSTI